MNANSLPIADSPLPWPSHGREQDLLTSLQHMDKPSMAWRRVIEDDLLQGGDDKSMLATWPEELLPVSGSCLVFVDGQYCSQLSCLDELPESLKCMPLAEAWQDHADLLQGWQSDMQDHMANPVMMLQCAYAQDGYFVHVPEGVACSQDIHLCHYVTGSCARVVLPMVVHMGAESCLKIVQQTVIVGDKPVCLAQTCHRDLGAGAKLQVVERQKIAAGAVLLSHTASQIGANAHLDSHISTMGSGYGDGYHQVDFVGEKATCRLHGLLLGRGKMQSDQHWQVNHLVPKCQSDMHYRALMEDRACGAWTGHAHVAKGACGSDVTQMSRQMLLGARARMHANPELSIYCDDVACRHGATVGKLDEQALFYLRSRGLGEEDAKQMLLWAFVQEVLAMWQGATWRDGWVEDLAQYLVCQWENSSVDLHFNPVVNKESVCG